MKSSGSVSDNGALEIIKRSKELLDSGAITQEEFEEIKRIYLMQFSDGNDETPEIKQVQKDQRHSLDYASDNFLRISDDKSTIRDEDYSWKSLFEPNAKQYNFKIPEASKSTDKSDDKIKNEDDSHENSPIIKHKNVSDESNKKYESEEAGPWYYTVPSPHSINAKNKQKKVKTRISKLSTKPTKKIEHESKVNSKPKFQNYKHQVSRLQDKFEVKEKNTRDLIEKCFPSPQITNTNFNHNVDECSEIFSHKIKSIMIIIDSTDDYSPKIENEIKSDIDSLKQIIHKLNSLHDELLIQMSDSDDDDFENLLDDMDHLIASVKDYEFDN